MRDLLSHTIGVVSGLGAAAAGDPPTEFALGTDPAAQFREAAAVALAAWRTPGVLDKIVDAGPGPMPGRMLAGISLLDTATHTWDIATATGQPAQLPARRREAALDAGRATISPEIRPGRFGPEVPASAAAGPTEQLVAFLGGPGWDEGCPSSSFWADSFEGTLVHLAHRDVSFVYVSRAPYPDLAAYRSRMSWTFPRYSLHDTRTQRRLPAPRHLPTHRSHTPARAHCHTRATAPSSRPPRPNCAPTRTRQLQTRRMATAPRPDTSIRPSRLDRRIVPVRLLRSRHPRDPHPRV